MYRMVRIEGRGTYMCSVLVGKVQRKSSKEKVYLSSTNEDIKEKDDTLWIDRRWNIADSQDGSSTSDKKLLKHLEPNCPENEYAYIEHARLPTLTSENSIKKKNHMNQFQDLAPYASTDILRDQIAYKKSSMYQVNNFKLFIVCIQTCVF